METELADSEAKVSSLQSDLKKAEDDIETQQTINSALSEELKNVKDPRHFASLTEMADWLQKDDTDTEYSVEDWTNMCLVLQVKALRDGYLLPACSYWEGGVMYVINQAYIEGEIYFVWANNDNIVWWDYTEVLPSHPLPMD